MDDKVYSDGVLKEVVKNKFDIIEGLQEKFLSDILHNIFGYLDGQSLLNAELVSLSWKAAVSDAQPSKLWRKILQKQITISPLWERLHFCLLFNFNISPTHLHYSRKLFNMIQYTIESFQKNWSKCNFARDYIVCDDGMTQSMFQIRNKYIAKLELKDNRFKIWNRQNLKLEEVYQIDNPQQFYNNFGVFVTDYELYEHALIYSSPSQDICIRNLLTKKTDVYKPFKKDINKCISYLRAENGFLTAAISNSVGEFLTNIVIWKMNSPTDVQWDSMQTLPPMKADNSRFFMDQRFFVILTVTESIIMCDARKMSEPGKKGKLIRIPKTRPEVLYSGGFLIAVNKRNNIVLVNVESGLSKTVLQTNIDFSDRSTFMRLHSGLLVVCSLVGNKQMPSKINVWDFNAIKESNEIVPLQPVYSIEAFMDPANVFHFDAFGFVTVGLAVNEPYHSTIQVIDFLPKCNSCKRIHRSLQLCGRCKSAKYCSSSCQKTDWRHHKEQCRPAKLTRG